METASEPVAAQAALPVTPFPDSLIFHSKPGSSNILFINFSGETVSNTAWNTSLGRTSVAAVPFSTDSDDTTFSDAEQTAIKRIWQRISEDYAPFEIDVTTERPATFTARTAHALITRSTDSTGAANPSSTGGGVGYVNVFGGAAYAKYRPSWIYFNNLSANESYIAEAASHEIGHNLGLSHDGQLITLSITKGMAPAALPGAPLWAPVTTGTSANGAKEIIIWPITLRTTWPSLVHISFIVRMTTATPRQRPRHS